MRRTLCVLLALTLLLFTLSGCSGLDMSWFTDKFKSGDAQTDAAPAETTPQQETTAVTTEVFTELQSFGLAYQPDYGLHPYNCESLNNRVIFSFLYEPLFAVTQELDAVPILAKDYSVSDDGTVTTITLQSGVRFHTGEPLTADDVVYSLESSRGTAYYGSRLRDVTAIEALDAQTVVLTTTVAYDELPLLLDIPIIQKDTMEQDVPPGTGPYKFESTERLVRNTDWWQDSAPLVDYDEITLTSVSTTAEIRDNFEYENINMVLTDPNSAAYAGFHNDYELWEDGTCILQYIGYNIGSRVFSNYGLRSAITYAIDRDTIVSDLMGGFAAAATLPCQPSSKLYDAKLALKYSYSMENFYRQLESASVEDMDHDGRLDLYVPSLGYAVPVSGTMLVCTSSYQRVQAATKIVQDLNALGFDLTLKSVDYEEYLTLLRAGNFDLYYGEVRLSPNFDLSPFFQSGGSLTYGSLADSTMQSLCNRMLVNSGNSYNLYQRLCDRGYLTPVMFKNYAVYTTRGSVTEPARYIDWLLPAPETVSD